MTLTTTVGGAASDSYITLAEFEAYWSARGVTLAGDSDGDSAHEGQLRRAADWIDRNYDFVGTRQYQTQFRAWPRIVSGLVNDWPVNVDTVPQAVKDAQAELAYLIHEGLTPWATVTGTVARTRSKAGPVETETEYQGGKSTPRLVAIEGMLAPYIKGGAYGQVRMARG